MIKDIRISGGYKSNPNLKRVGEEIEWTEEHIKEFVKCSRDPLYFIETYMKVVNEDRGLVPLVLYDYQRDMLMSIHENRNSVFATARQVGKTTVTCAYILWFVIFNSEKTVALLANKGDVAREILGKIYIAYQNLPKWLQQGVKEANKGALVLENTSRIIAEATTSESIRGYTISLLYIDECAFVENFDEFFTSVVPTVSSGQFTKIVLSSTPRGLNHFYKIWNNAIQNINDYHPVWVDWRKVPGRDEAWKQATLKQLNYDMERFTQEYEISFLGSSSTLISGAALKEIVCRVPIAEREGLCQYVESKQGRIYSIVCDVSRGKGLDYSAFSVIDITEMPYQQVCVYRSNMITPLDYAEVIHKVGKMYNNAYVLVEINDIGEQVSMALMLDHEYENVLCTENAGTVGKRIAINVDRSDPGIRTTKTVKNLGCTMLKLLIEQKQFIVNDHETVHELSTFSKNGKSYEAERGCHDDLVMGLVIFAWLTEQDYFRVITDIRTLQTLRDKTDDDISHDLLPFGFHEDYNMVKIDPLFSLGDIRGEHDDFVENYLGKGYVLPWK